MPGTSRLSLSASPPGYTASPSCVHFGRPAGLRFSPFFVEGRGSRSPRVPQGCNVLRPLTGGPPSEQGPRSGFEEEQDDTGQTKQRRAQDSSTAGRTGKAPLESQSRLTPRLPPDAKRQHKPPSNCAILEPTCLPCSLSLSLSLSPSLLCTERIVEGDMGRHAAACHQRQEKGRGGRSEGGRGERESERGRGEERRKEEQEFERDGWKKQAKYSTRLIPAIILWKVMDVY